MMVSIDLRSISWEEAGSFGEDPEPDGEVFLDLVIGIIEEHLSDPVCGIDLLILSRELGMLPSEINRKLSAVTDQSAGDLIHSARLQRAAVLLSGQTGIESIEEISRQVGFSNPASFIRSFERYFDCHPAEYLENVKCKM